MRDHRWLSLAENIAGWEGSMGGYVVVHDDKLTIGSGNFVDVESSLTDCTLYVVRPEVEWETDKLNGCARIVVPRGGTRIIGVDFVEEVEI